MRGEPPSAITTVDLLNRTADILVSAEPEVSAELFLRAARLGQMKYEADNGEWREGKTPKEIVDLVNAPSPPAVAP